MSVQFRPVKRENTPVVAGISGPTKSGKTYSAHRLAQGLAQGGKVAMINTEGAKGHQYADKFNYIATDISAPFRPEKYTQALDAALKLNPKPAVVIIDSCSHMWDGPGGILEWHEAELERLTGGNENRRGQYTWTAWIKPKAEENQFIYAMLDADVHLVLCFRAKEKLKIVTGQNPIPLGWQPIASERVAFETGFTLVLPPHSKGVPDLEASEMREPFDTLIPGNKPLSEETGLLLARWSAGSGNGSGTATAAQPPRNQVTRKTFQSILAARMEADVSGEWLRKKLTEVGLKDVPEQVTQATLKMLTEAQGKDLLSALSAIVDQRNAGATA